MNLKLETQSATNEIENRMQPLNLSQIALQGIHLIEASAGTGKTYTIAGLYVRLLLERKLRPEQVLVVTFTEAATKELKERIRARLLNALSVLLGENNEPADDFDRELGRRFQKDPSALSVLTNAVRSVDLAAIHTIHGFCNRLLEEFAFESGARFEAEFINDDADILQQIIDDFWQKQAPAWDDILTGYLHAIGCSADSLFGELAGIIRQTVAYGGQTVLYPDRQAPAGFGAHLASLASIWKADRNGILAGLSCGALSQAKDRYCSGNVASWSADLDRYFNNASNRPPPITTLMKFSTRALTECTKKNKETPKHMFYEAVEGLFDRLQKTYQAIRASCIDYCTAELPTRKKQRGVFTFDDLLLDVRNSLQAPGAGKRFAGKVRAKYPVALIDEFQDTDPVQFEIFQAIYQAGNVCLFLIGDPKQAIYNFRGADIFAYLRAARDSKNRHALDTNYRSEALLIEAVNGLFQLNDNPFVFQEIEFSPVLPAKKRRDILQVEEDTDRPLTIWHFAEQQNRNEAKQLVARSVAGKIVSLLMAGRQGKAMLGESPLAASDIAVLVRSHADGEIIRRALQARGVPAVIYSQEGIYSSFDAWELQLLLGGICRPWDERRLKTALTTTLLGRTAQDLSALEKMEKNGQAWEETAERFAAYQQLWQEHGLSAMLRRLLAREGVDERLASYPDAERRLTNIRHLMDLLQEEVHREGHGPSDLLLWLQAKRHNARQIEDKEQLRLESDEHLVKIVTIHKSKGLEYPVVFCPFLWDARPGKSRECHVAVFHDDDKTLRIDLGTEDIARHRHLQQVEALAEELRLLYVALTRARNRCYLSWGKVMSGRTVVSADSALGYLILPSDSSESSGDDFWGPLQRYAAAAKEAVAFLPLPSATGEDFDPAGGMAELGAARIFHKGLQAYEMVHSFSSLLYQAERSDIDEPDYDAEIGVLPFENRKLVVPSERSMFTFPRGKWAGSCLHAIFEDLDFQKAREEESLDLVAGWLKRFGFDEQWAAPVMDGIRAVLNTPLESSKEGFNLGRLAREQRLDELEFYYPVPTMSREELRKIFVRHLGGAWTAEDRKTIRNHGCGLECGFMKGFIDLVFHWQGKFYLVDYKSNHLGDTVEEYHQARLAEVVTRAGYDLQYHIYTVALHRYLKKRLGNQYDYDRHLGGVYYLFIRGMLPDNGTRYGVYRDRPARELVESLDRCLYLPPTAMETRHA